MQVPLDPLDKLLQVVGEESVRQEVAGLVPVKLHQPEHIAEWLHQP
jgi:hypothetical protein